MLTALIVLASACRPDAPPSAPPGPHPGAEAPPAPPPPPELGSVAVSVSAPGAADPQVASADPACPSGPLGGVVLGEGGSLAGALVWVDEDVKVPPAAGKLAFRKCRIEPRVLALPPDSAVSVHNEDRFPHRIEVAGTDAAAKDLVEGATVGVPLPGHGAFTLRCTLHPWEEATAVLATHVAGTGPDGRARLEGLPAGEHMVKVEHPLLGRREARVTVAKDKESVVEVVIAPINASAGAPAPGAPATP